MPNGPIKTVRASISKPRSEQAAQVAPALMAWLAERGVGVRSIRRALAVSGAEGGSVPARWSPRGANC